MRLERSLVARQTLLRGEDARFVPQQPDPTVPVGDQVVDRLAGATPIVCLVIAEHVDV